MQLAFYFTSNWSRTCYFVDHKTGQKVRIMNGLIISIEMPQNHEQRYYIEGPDEYIGSGEGGVTTSTSNPYENNSEATLQAYSVAEGELIVNSNQLIQHVKIHDLAGRLLVDKPLGLLQSSTTMTAPSGICIVEAIMQNGKSLYTQALVK
jgi:hypothetical protein